MKKLVLILIVSMSFVAGVFAQSNFKNNDRVKELRKKFFTKELQLTDAESKAFWPLFNQHQKAQKDLRGEYKPNRPTEGMTDEQLKAHMDNKFVYDQKKAELKKTYFDKFAKVLPLRKVSKLEATERKFKKEVFKKVRENRKKNN